MFSTTPLSLHSHNKSHSPITLVVKAFVMAYLPRRLPSQTRAEGVLHIQFFSQKWDGLNEDCGGKIKVASNKVVHMDVLCSLGGSGADPKEAAMLALIGALNEYLNLPSSTKDKYKSIASEVSKSPDVLMVITPAVNDFLN